MGERVIYITKDEQFDLLSEGEPDLKPVRFPKEDVFKYDAELATSFLCSKGRKISA